MFGANVAPIAVVVAAVAVVVAAVIAVGFKIGLVAVISHVYTYT